MLAKPKANLLFHRLLKLPDINKAYALSGPETPWYDTLTTVHHSLALVRRLETVKNGRYPILASAGSNERMDDVLLTIQKNNPMETEVLILPGCDHGNGMYKQTEMYQNAIKAFLERHLSAAK